MQSGMTIMRELIENIIIQ